MKYAIIRNDGTAAAFYDSAVHGLRGKPNCRVPAEAVEITESQYVALLAAPPALTPMTPAMVRAMRDARLKSSDWTQVPDAPLTKAARSAWANYRRALRDITAQPLDSLEWPVPPGSSDNAP